MRGRGGAPRHSHDAKPPTRSLHCAEYNARVVDDNVRLPMRSTTNRSHNGRPKGKPRPQLRLSGRGQVSAGECRKTVIVARLSPTNLLRRRGRPAPIERAQYRLLLFAAKLLLLRTSKEGAVPKDRPFFASRFVLSGLLMRTPARGGPFARADNQRSRGLRSPAPSSSTGTSQGPASTGSEPRPLSRFDCPRSTTPRRRRKAPTSGNPWREQAAARALRSIQSRPITLPVLPSF